MQIKKEEKTCELRYPNSSELCNQIRSRKMIKKSALFTLLAFSLFSSHSTFATSETSSVPVNIDWVGGLEYEEPTPQWPGIIMTIVSFILLGAIIFHTITFFTLKKKYREDTTTEESQKASALKKKKKHLVISIILFLISLGTCIIFSKLL